VLKAYEKRQSQLTMDQFLSFNQRFAKIKSKRLQKAVNSITGGRADPDMFLADVSKVVATTAPEGRDGEGGTDGEGGLEKAASASAGVDGAKLGKGSDSKLPAVKRKRQSHSVSQQARGGGSKRGWGRGKV